MGAFLLRRTAGLAATLLAISVLVFLALEVLPGDVALLMLGTEVREDTLQALREELGLAGSAPERYFDWLGGLVTGSLGQSLTYRVPVADLVAERVAVSLPLAALAFALAVAVALPLGVYAATRRGRAGDYAVMGFAQIGLAVPSFWFGMLSILVFAVALNLTRAGGFPGWGDGIGPALGALVLPAVTLAVAEAAILARVVRSAVLETLGEDYVRTARAKGLAPRAVLFGHVLRNALIPVVTIMGLQFAFLIAGAVVVETVFTLPGLGQLLVQSIFQRDLVVVKSVVLLFAAVVVLVNFLVDVTYALIDPRPRQAG